MQTLTQVQFALDQLRASPLSAVIHPPYRALRTGLAAMIIALLVGLGQATAHDFKKGDLSIDHPTATPTAPGQPHGAIFIEKLKNSGAKDDQLIAARSGISKSMEVHRMSMDKGVMAMREIPGVTIPARGEVSMARGSKEGYHLMLMNLNRPLKEGEKFPVTLIFKNAGEVTVEIEVEKRSGAKHGHHTATHKSGAAQGHKH